MTTVKQRLMDYLAEQDYVVPHEASPVADRILEIVNMERFDPVRDIEHFHRKFELEYTGGPRTLEHDLAKFRSKFMQEELDEYNDYIPSPKEEVVSSGAEVFRREKQFDAIIDLVYVALGTAYLHGFDFREGWRRVHHANMQKVRVNQETLEGSVRKSKFDVVKPAGWKAPSLIDLVRGEYAELTESPQTS